MQIISQPRKVHEGTQRNRRRNSSTERTAPASAAPATTPDFLRYNFLPLCAPSDTPPGKQEVEQDFFKSLDTLTRLCQIEPLCVTGKPYPYNILLSHWDAQRKICQSCDDTELFIIKENEKVLLSTRDSIDADHKLFYIPVKPLYLLSQAKRKQNRQATLMLYSVFAYLYHTVQLPYYRSEDTYQYWHYDMIETWLLETEQEQEDATEFASNCKELEEAKQYGDFIESKIYSLDNLRYFGQRLRSFRPVTEWQQRCAAIGSAFYELFQNFPDAKITDHLTTLGNPPFDEEDEDEYEGCINIDQYVAFVATTEGWLGDSLFRMVSDELNECVIIEQPAITLQFDEHRTAIDDSIAFERKLFFLIGELTTLLNELL